MSQAEPQTDPLDLPLRKARAAWERDYLAGQLARHKGNIVRSAKAAGMDRSAFHRRIKEVGLGDTLPGLRSGEAS